MHILLHKHSETQIYYIYIPIYAHISIYTHMYVYIYIQSYMYMYTNTVAVFRAVQRGVHIRSMCRPQLRRLIIRVCIGKHSQK